MHGLDNPVWASLRERHAQLGLLARDLGRYRAEVAPFAAVSADGLDAAAGLEQLVHPGEEVLFVGPAPRLPAHWQVQAPVPIAQMVSPARIESNGLAQVILLGEVHLADMLALTALVYPHYFRPGTPRMGRYIGIYDGTVLAAMAGERMGFDGHQEISAVCTHPDHTGRGHARQLVAELNNAIVAAGQVPFLHVSPQNTRAKALYEQLGFRHRRDVLLRAVRRPA